MDIAAVVEHLIRQLPWVWALVEVIGAVMGLGLTAAGVYRLTAIAGPAAGRGGAGGAIMAIVAGVTLANVATGADVVSASLVDRAPSVLIYGPSVPPPPGVLAQPLPGLRGSPAAALLGALVVGVVRIIGLVGFIYGLYLLSLMGSGTTERVGGQAAARIIGGTLAINIISVIRILVATFSP